MSENALENMTAEEIREALDNDPTAFESLVAPVLHRQYQQALEALCAVMQDPGRERGTVTEALHAVLGSGRAAPQHIPGLVEVERVAREMGGTGYMEVERKVFEEMESLRHPDLVPGLLAAFQYHRSRDRFTRERRAHAVYIVALIAALTGAEEALAALAEMIAHPTPEVREAAARGIYETYVDIGAEASRELLDLFWQVARHDLERPVRQTALACLQRWGEVSYEEAMHYLEDEEA